MTDSLYVAVFDTTLHESLKNQGDYIYDQQVEGKSFWDSLREWFFGWLRDSGIELGEWVENIIIVVAVSLFLYGVYWVIKSRIIVGKKNARIIAEPELSPYQKEWDAEFLEEQHQEALNAEDWSLAVHWVYHKALVHLNNAGIIKRSKFKISSDYLKEISAPQLKAAFSDLRFIHQLAWYDEKELGAQDHERALEYFGRIQKEAGNEA